jgi:hypothetical protein
MLSLQYNLRSLTARAGTSVTTALGIAVVVFLFAGVRMFAGGLREAVEQSGAPDVAVVLRQGATNELTSAIEEGKVGLVAALPAVGRNDDGRPEARADLSVAVRLERVGGGVAEVRLRGVGAAGLGVDRMRLVRGRMARPGHDEAVVGSGVADRFLRLRLGERLPLPRGRALEIVGVFEAGGSLVESEVWTEIATLRDAFGLHGLVSSLRVRLRSPAALAELKTAVAADADLGLEVLGEREYYRRFAGGFPRLVAAVATLVVALFSLATMLGAAVTMQASIARRRKEIGILHALGFSRASVLASILLECALLAAAGGAVGAAASLALGNVGIVFYNASSGSAIALALRVSPLTLATALLLAVVVGVAGGLWPAVRAARLEPAEAMRS